MKVKEEQDWRLQEAARLLAQINGRPDGRKTPFDRAGNKRNLVLCTVRHLIAYLSKRREGNER